MSEPATDVSSATAESSTRSLTEVASRLWTDRNVRSMLIAGIVVFAIYELSREPGTQPYNQYVRLARSFIEGRVDLANPPPHLELAVFEGRSYSHQGVLPAILLIPFVLVFGDDFNLRHFAALLGGGISIAAWSLATRIGLSGKERLLGWAFPVLGTTIWFEAKAGSTWGVAALASVLCLFLALNEFFGERRLWLVGLFVGLAGMARPPALLAGLGFAVAVRQPKKMAQLALGAAGPVIAIFGYNLLRFGSIVDKSQELHYMADGFRLQRPPGQFSPAHLPFNLYSWFFLGPEFQGNFPYIRPTIMGTALPLTSPAFLTAIGSRRERWLWLAALCAVAPAALHYANGFTQFGMRYLLDAVPFLSALIFLALRDGRASGYAALLSASIAINAYGVAYTTVFGLDV